MEKWYKLSAITCGIILFSVFVSCKKTEYVPGPKGDPGLPGDTGNVKLSVITFAASSWSLSGGNWESSFKSTKITNNAVLSGEVDVYMKVGEQWWPLPYGVGDVFMQATFEDQWVHLDYFKIHGGPPSNPGTVLFRLAVMEPL